jgi:hypothetical protein
MSEYGISMKDEEVDEIFKVIANREISEGIPVSHRFRNVLRSFYTVDPFNYGVKVKNVRKQAKTLFIASRN